MHGVLASANGKGDEAAGKPTRRGIWIFAVVILLVSQALLLHGIDQPRKLYFDEAPYVGAARAYLQQQPPLNRIHPPLAKWFIAQSIALLGDNPLGWRYAAACFGSLSLVGIYLWGLALFRDHRPALWATAVTFCNQVLFIQARIAMLDVFALAFTLWAMAAFAATWNERSRGRLRFLFLAAGILFGLACACKWSGLFPLLLTVALVAGIKLWQSRGPSFREAGPDDWFRPDLWRGVGPGYLVVALGVAPLLVYYLTFASVGSLAPVAFLAAQAQIFQRNVTIAQPHPYMTGWAEWPILRRGVWYIFEGGPGDETRPTAQAILYLGNPLVLWSGLVALIPCLVGWLRQRRREAMIILAAYFAFWLVWAVLPRRVTFAYYYLPAAMVLSLALAYVFYRTRLDRWPWMRWLFLGAALAVFWHFLPISSAAVGVSLPRFNALMWLNSWR